MRVFGVVLVLIVIVALVAGNGGKKAGHKHKKGKKKDGGIAAVKPAKAEDKGNEKVKASAGAQDNTQAQAAPPPPPPPLIDCATGGPISPEVAATCTPNPAEGCYQCPPLPPPPPPPFPPPPPEYPPPPLYPPPPPPPELPPPPPPPPVVPPPPPPPVVPPPPPPVYAEKNEEEGSATDDVEASASGLEEPAKRPTLDLKALANQKRSKINRILSGESKDDNSDTEDVVFLMRVDENDDDDQNDDEDSDDDDDSSGDNDVKQAKAAPARYPYGPYAVVKPLPDKQQEESPQNNVVEVPAFNGYPSANQFPAAGMNDQPDHAVVNQFPVMMQPMEQTVPLQQQFFQAPPQLHLNQIPNSLIEEIMTFEKRTHPMKDHKKYHKKHHKKMEKHHKKHHKEEDMPKSKLSY